MLYNKRSFLKYMLSAFSLLSLKSWSEGNPYRDRFQTYRQTFRVEPDKGEALRIINNIIRGKKYVSGIINLKAPDVAEDGNVVPVSFEIKCSMQNDDFPTKVHVLAMENPFPEIAIYEFFQGSGKAEVTFRCRMRTSSKLVVICEMADGRVSKEEKFIDIMLGACS